MTAKPMKWAVKAQYAADLAMPEGTINLEEAEALAIQQAAEPVIALARAASVPKMEAPYRCRICGAECPEWVDDHKPDCPVPAYLAAVKEAKP